ncbi:MAG: ABC transporter ATP-binding protein [Actinobacteria bacterium]|nr:ABC transporter ATP-binding protein [Actinomycetota bacterium]MCG2799339.1 ABC transporter ATP-binding protein [Cellulomonas sp.]
MGRLSAEHVSFGYDGVTVVHDVSLTLAEGQMTVVVGPNACGKSTLVRGLARLLTPTAGRVLLDGVPIGSIPARRVAQRVGVLPQQATAPGGLTVAELVGRGRAPHHGFFGRWSAADDEVVAGALTDTGTLELADRRVDELSGGQRQRVWIAMALAQQTPVLLLDEPTTYLDVTHQIEVLELVLRRNREQGTTVAMVLHDLNLAARYAHTLVVMSAGRVVRSGPPREVLDAATVREAFGLACTVVPDPETGTPMVVPAASGILAIR